MRCHHEDYKAGDLVYYKRDGWLRGIISGRLGKNRFLITDAKATTSSYARYRRNIRPRVFGQ